MHFTVLGSGSSGNAILIEAHHTRILIDAGFSARELTKRLQNHHIQPHQLNAILITHEHSDHIKGIQNFCKQNPHIPVHVTAPTQRVLERDKGITTAKWHIINQHSQFQVGDLQIQSYPITHDAIDPLGFTIQAAAEHQQQEQQAQPRKLGILTDTGKPSRTAIQHLSGCHAAVLEANYDPKLLLADTRRPPSIKTRIQGHHGHLSNQQSAELLSQLVPQGLHTAVLCHLSKDCNQPTLALSAARSALSQLPDQHRRPIKLHCASQDLTTPWITV